MKKCRRGRRGTRDGVWMSRGKDGVILEERE